MKAFLGGFLKGLAGCLAVVILGLAVCHFSGLLELVRKDEMQAETEERAETVPDEMLPEKEPEQPAAAQEEASGDSESGTAVISLEDPGKEALHLLFAGDLFLTDVLQSKYQKSGIAAAASERLLTQLQAADLFVLNQEFPFGTTGEAMEEKEYTFRVHPDFVSLEQELGVDLVTLANNHMLDFGREPLLETLETLDQAGISHVGAGRSLEEAGAWAVFDIQGRTIGFLGATRVIPVVSWNAGAQTSGLFTTYDAAKLTEQIRKAKEVCDFVAVYVHWGVERSQTPEDYQQELARAYIDAGADAVIGSHPHVIQGIEYYRGKPILYSLGNFIFSNGPYETMLAELILKEEGCQVRLIPCVSNQNQMDLMEETAFFYENVEGLSFGISIDAEGLVRE